MTVYAAYTATVGTALTPSFGNVAPSAGAAATVLTDATTADDDAALHEGTLKTNVASAIATLVADGASPTQGHVNTLNTAWGLLSTAMTTTKTATAAAKVSATTANSGASGADVILQINATNVVTKNKLLEIVRGFLLRIDGSSLLT